MSYEEYEFNAIKGTLTNMSIEITKQLLAESEEKLKAAMNRCDEQGIDRVKDVEFLQHHLSNQIFKQMLFTEQVDQFIKVRRDNRMKELNKQYGIASNTIHKQRGEIAQLRLKLQDKTKGQ